MKTGGRQASSRNDRLRVSRVVRLAVDMVREKDEDKERRRPVRASRAGDRRFQCILASRFSSPRGQQDIT